jgi:maltose alpha-D-glucosyltransferase / alpha-amylase
MYTDLSTPAHFSNFSPGLQELIGGIFAERISLLGKRTAEMHQALIAHPKEKDFEPEAFSLHYQRSVYSSLQSLTRGSFQTLKANLKNLPESIREEAEEILGRKDEVLEVFKRIFDHKITTTKIRIHGDYHLGQVLWTGKDFMIIDFEGEPARAYSERRLKRSPVRDLAGMIRSLHYASYTTVLQDEFRNARKDDDLRGWAEVWFQNITRVYLQGYLDQIKDIDLLPEDEGDFRILLETFLLEKAVYELSYELNSRPDWVIIPLRGIKTILNRLKDE